MDFTEHVPLNVHWYTASKRHSKEHCSIVILSASFLRAGEVCLLEFLWNIHYFTYKVQIISVQKSNVSVFAGSHELSLSP